MAFKSKSSYYIGTIDGLQLVSQTEGKNTSVAEAVDENGFTIAKEVYADLNSPSEQYVIKSNAQLTGIKLGGIKEVDDKSYCIKEVSITTGAGTVPSMTIAGQQVEDDATETCTTTLTGISVSPLHHAQTFGAFAVQGQGAHITNSSFKATCNLATANKDGMPLAHDITNSKLEIGVTIVVSDSQYATPTLSCANGWYESSKLTLTNPDSDYPSYTATLTKYLSADA